VASFRLPPSSWLIAGTVVAVTACSGRRDVVHLGAERAERGGDRACGRLGGKLGRGALPHDDAHADAEALACAARTAREPQPIEVERSVAGGSAPTCSSAAQCYDGFFPTGDPFGDVSTLGKRCGLACGMTAASKTYEAAGADDEAPRVFAIELDAATCYRVLAVGGDGVRVLRAAIADADGRVVVIDNSRDRAPMLGPRDPFCPSGGGLFRLVVGVERGAGDYALRIWSRPRTAE
jgi:hypothetical protein